MTMLAKDARFFVDGVTKYLKSDTAQSPILPKVTAALHKITASARKEKTALVESVVPLTAKEKADITRMVSRHLLHSVTVAGRVNKELLGGLRIAVGDWIVDTSIATQIHAMQEQLIP